MTGGLADKLAWRRSRHCESGACVEVAAVDNAVLIRSSASPEGAQLALGHDKWREFVGRVKRRPFCPQ
ncbi:MAG: DUF397 domain-containing protein [Streptosporangiaceae bacterium]